MSGTGIGASVRRVEDERFIRGRGRYVDDIERPNQAHAFVVRSTVAHGTIRRIETSAAASAPGVLGVYVGSDLINDGIGFLPAGWMVTNIDGTPMHTPQCPVVAIDRVRHVGEPVAVVFAETLAQAKDAAELIEIDIEAKPEKLAMTKKHLCAFLEAGSGGTAAYTGRDMRAAHRGMNINEAEYLAALDDADRLWLVGERSFADGLYPVSRRALERFVQQYPKDARLPEAWRNPPRGPGGGPGGAPGGGRRP